MPNGFCVDGGETGNIIAINHAAKVVIRKFYQFAPADQVIHVHSSPSVSVDLLLA
jgi:hypothetical protein